MFLAAGLPILALAFAAGARPPDFELTIDVSALTPLLPPRELRAMIQETAAIWDAPGMRFVWSTTPAATSVAGLPVLRVVDAPAGQSTGRVTPLGVIAFREGAITADEVIGLSLKAVGRMVDGARWANRRVTDWPPGLRATLAGRALGRVLAHEIGHYLLAWRAHTPTGLMRSRFNVVQLIDPERREFDVPAILRGRLQARLAQIAGSRLARQGDQSVRQAAGGQ